jgi:hypothetical protein
MSNEIKRVDVSYNFTITLDGRVQFTTMSPDRHHVQIMEPEVAEMIANSLTEAARKARLVKG